LALRDRESGTLYVLARTSERKGWGKTDYKQTLHALAITPGVEKFGGPKVINASVAGSGPDSSHGQVAFNALRENPRSALLLVNGNMFLTWASSCDVGPYHGWVMAYDAHSLAQKAVLNTSPDSVESGIWMSDTGPAADADGNVYVTTGNGSFDAGNAGGRDYGDSVLKLSIQPRGFVLSDYFTPANQKGLNARDDDLGSGGPLLLPDQDGPHRQLLVAAGKGGVVYVIDRQHMGKYEAESPVRAVQTIAMRGGLYGAPAYWNGHLFYYCADDYLKDFTIRKGRLSEKPESQTLKTSGYSGETPTISANGTANGIVWIIQTKSWNGEDRPAVFEAYSASNLRSQLYSSEQNNSRDRAGMALRFTIPTVVNGHVYVGTKNELDVYGLVH
jgi:hypothetical protein